MNYRAKAYRAKAYRAKAYRAKAKADDFVILSSGYANEALEWTRGVMERLELTLNESKTSVRNARRERFDFLGYTFGPHYSIALKRMRTGREYIGNSPSKKSVARIKEKVGDLLVPGNLAPWKEVCEQLNRSYEAGEPTSDWVTSRRRIGRLMSMSMIM